jgi:hypothetical protein
VAPVPERTSEQIVLDAHPRKQATTLRDYGKASRSGLFRRQAIEPPTVENNRAGKRFQQAGQAANQGGLTCAVGAQQRHNAAVGHV